MSNFIIDSYRFVSNGCSSYPDSLAGTADGNNNSATIVTATGAPSGIGENCLNFTASSASSGQSVNIPDNSAFDWSSGGSINFWVQPDVILDRRFVAKGSNTGWEVLSEGAGKNVRFRIKPAGATHTIIGTTELVEGDASKWYMLTATWSTADSGTMRLYVDGTEEASATSVGTIATNTDDVYLGSNSSPSQYYDGKMSSVSLFDYAISTDTIAELWADSNGASVSELTTSCEGIIAYYSCQEFDGSGDLPNNAIPT